MASSFGFGSLTGVNGQRIDWAVLQRYDINRDNEINSDEYNTMLREVNSDGFNGITAFGTIDTEISGQITESEFKKIEQEVKICEYADNFLESMSHEERSASVQNAITSFVRSYSSTYLAEHNNDSTGMYGQFIEDFTTFINEHKTSLELIETIKSDASLSAVLIDTVNKSNENGYINSQELSDIKKAARDYALQQILNGDYSFLADTGITQDRLDELKALVDSLAASSNLAETLEAVKNCLNSLIATRSETDIISATVKVEANNQAKEEAKNDKTEQTYTLNPLELDYSGIDGYNENKKVSAPRTKDIHDIYNINQTKILAQETIEKLRGQMKSILETQCSAAGLNFDEALFTSIFDAAKTSAIDACVLKGVTKSAFFRKRTSSFETKTLVDTFTSTFNAKMAETIKKLNAPQEDAKGVPTLNSLTTSYLDDDNSELTSEQIELKNLQQRLLTEPKARVKQAEAETVINVVAAELKNRMIEKLGAGSTNLITNLINEAKTETLSGLKLSGGFFWKLRGETLEEIVTKFYETFQAKYASGAGVSLSA